LLFKEHTEDQNYQLLAQHMPTGMPWENVFNEESNLGKLVKSLSKNYYRLELLIKIFYNEMQLSAIDALIESWEKEVGIPDVFFQNTGAISVRRDQVAQKLGNFGGAQTEDDFIRIALYFGYSINIIQCGIEGVGFFPLIFPIRFFSSRKTASNTIIIQVDDLADETFLRSILQRLIPVTTQMIFELKP